jgi:hypothetical protein
MPDPVPRPSLTNCLADRYGKQHAGGAFDATGPQPDMFGWLEKQWTVAGFAAGGQEKLGLGGKKLYTQSEGNKGLNTSHKYSPNTV